MWNVKVTESRVSFWIPPLPIKCVCISICITLCVFVGFDITGKCVLHPFSTNYNDSAIVVNNWIPRYRLSFAFRWQSYLPTLPKQWETTAIITHLCKIMQIVANCNLVFDCASTVIHCLKHFEMGIILIQVTDSF